MLSSPKILILLPSGALDTVIGEHFTELKEVDSTNNYAMACIDKGLAKHGSTWLAQHQTAGKGQRGKSWHNNPGESILMSVALNAHLPKVSGQFHLSAVIALAVLDFLNNYATTFKIKWPNDIYWYDTKAAGILIENIIRGKNWQWSVVGIGVNINQVQFDSLVTNAVSLKQITGKNYSIADMAKELCRCIQQRYEQLQYSAFKYILQQYNAALYKLNEDVLLKKNNTLFNCCIKEVNESGHLIAEDSEKKYLEFSKVEWIIK